VPTDGGRIWIEGWQGEDQGCYKNSSLFHYTPSQGFTLGGCLKSQRESQAIPMESDNHCKIQCFSGPLAGNYT
jgi:hypothetical protein